MKVRSLESVPIRDIYVYVMYYVYVTSGPSLLIESTDSMIWGKSFTIIVGISSQRVVSGLVSVLALVDASMGSVTFWMPNFLQAGTYMGLQSYDLH